MTETFPLDEACVRTWAPTSCARCARPIALAHSKHNTHVTHSVTQHDKQRHLVNLCTFIYRKCVSAVIKQLRCVPVKQVVIHCGFLGHMQHSRGWLI